MVLQTSFQKLRRWQNSFSLGPPTRWRMPMVLPTRRHSERLPMRNPIRYRPMEQRYCPIGLHHVGIPIHHSSTASIDYSPQWLVFKHPLPSPPIRGFRTLLSCDLAERDWMEKPLRRPPVKFMGPLHWLLIQVLQYPLLPTLHSPTPIECPSWPCLGAMEHCNRTLHNMDLPRHKRTISLLNQNIIAEYLKGQRDLPPPDHHHFRISMGNLFTWSLAYRQAWYLNVTTARQHQAERVWALEDEWEAGYSNSCIIQWIQTGCLAECLLPTLNHTLQIPTCPLLYVLHISLVASCVCCLNQTISNDCWCLLVNKSLAFGVIVFEPINYCDIYTSTLPSNTTTVSLCG